jgi:hypothetical protein
MIFIFGSINLFSSIYAYMLTNSCKVVHLMVQNFAVTSGHSIWILMKLEAYVIKLLIGDDSNNMIFMHGTDFIHQCLDQWLFTLLLLAALPYTLARIYLSTHAWWNDPFKQFSDPNWPVKSYTLVMCIYCSTLVQNCTSIVLPQYIVIGF